MRVLVAALLGVSERLLFEKLLARKFCFWSVRTYFEHWLSFSFLCYWISASQAYAA